MEEAIAEARATDVATSAPAALLYRGLMLSQEEKYAESIPFLEEALRQDPSLQAGWEPWAGRTSDRTKGKSLAPVGIFSTSYADQWMPLYLLAQSAIMQQDWRAADTHF
jgi:tetratricopeptide (TPR) repeat protein